jgi:hypothetical protein
MLAAHWSSLSADPELLLWIEDGDTAVARECLLHPNKRPLRQTNHLISANSRSVTSRVEDNLIVFPELLDKPAGVLVTN